MKDKDYHKYHYEALDGLKSELKRNNRILNIIVKGSSNSKKLKKPFWSDLDISVVVENVDVNTLNFLSKTYNQFKKKYPAIRLSLTPVNKEDNIESNPFHHHGIKPISYNFELVNQNNIKGYNRMPYDVSNDVIIISSMYRYYEILYEMRKSVILNEMNDIRFVSKYFHRASRFIRTYMEIMNPDEVKKTGKIDETGFSGMNDNNKIIDIFFKEKNRLEKNWIEIIRNKEELEKYKEFVIKTIEDLNRIFLPTLINSAKRFTHYVD